MRIAVSLVFSLLVAFVFGQSTREVDRYIEDLMKKRGVPGLSLAIVKSGKVTYSKGYGLADIENNVKASPETVYEIGSISKQFTAAIVMQLVQEGKVKLDEPARTYLPELPEAWNRVTVCHLLTHTSGIKSYTNVRDFNDHMREPTDTKGFLDYVSKEPVEFAPGERWNYSNSGYFLLGLLVEKVTGKGFGVALKERILAPLGMSSTSLNDSASIVKHRAKGYDPNPLLGPKNTTYVDMTWPFAAGGILSSAIDLAKWDAALYGDRILKQGTWKEAWTPVKLNDGSTFDYGFGWALGKINDTPILEHAGDINGFNADILRIPDKRLTIIALCNAGPGITTVVTKAVAGMVDPELKKKPVVPIKDLDPALTATHRAVFQDAIDGKMKKELFTEEMQKRLFPEFAEQVHRFLSAFGTLMRFDLISESVQQGARIRRYQVVVGNMELQTMFATTPDGKIGGFSVKAAD